MTMAYTTSALGNAAVTYGTAFTTTPSTLSGGTATYQILNIGSPAPKSGTEETTNMSSPADSNNNVWKEIIGTIIDPGTITFEVVIESAKLTHYKALWDIMNVMKGWNVSLAGTGNGYWAFNGILTEVGQIQLDQKKKMTCKFTVAISGPVIPVAGT